MDQQVRPALVELAKAMTTSDSGLDVGPVVDHLDATVRSLLAQDNAELAQLEVWEAILDRLPSETQVRWAQRLASLAPERIEEPAPEEKAGLQPQADDLQATPPSDPEPSSPPEGPTGPTDPTDPSGR